MSLKLLLICVVAHQLSVSSALPTCYFQARTGDYVFLIDSSGSVGSDGVISLRAFAASLLSVLNLPNSYGGDIRMAARPFNISVDYDQGFPLDTDLNIGNKVDKVNAIPWNGGGTYTHKALRSTLNDFQRDPSIPRIVVLFQEGTYISSPKAQAATQELADAGIRVYVVAANPTQSISNFAAATRTWTVSSVNGLQTVYSSLLENLCGAE